MADETVQPTAQETTDSNLGFLKEAIFLAGFTAYLYIVDYRYRSALADYFQYPISIIPTTPYIIVQTVYAIGTFFIIWLLIRHVLLSFVSALETPIGRAIKETVSLFLPSLLFILVVPWNVYTLSFLGISLILDCLLIFCLPLITARKVPTYIGKLLHVEKTRNEYRSTSFSRRLELKFGLAGKNVFFVAFLIFLLANPYGYTVASSQSQFYTIPELPYKAVVAMTDEILILQSYDPKTNIMSGVLSFQKPKDLNTFHLVKKNLGRLINTDRKLAFLR